MAAFKYKYKIKTFLKRNLGILAILILMGLLTYLFNCLDLPNNSKKEREPIKVVLEPLIEIRDINPFEFADIKVPTKAIEALYRYRSVR